MRQKVILKSLSAGLACMLVLFLASVNFGSPASAQTDSSSQSTSYVPGKIAVKFKDNTSDSVKNQILIQVGAQEEQYISNIKVHILRVKNPTAQEHIIQELKNRSEVKYAEPIYYRHATFTPNDTYFSQEWNLQKIQSPSAWDIDQDASSVTIAVVDTGVDANHPDLQVNLVPGWNFDSSSPYYNTEQTQDDFGHGTHVAGISAAATNNGTGIAGVSFNAHIMPVKVLNSSGTGNDQDIANGIVWAADHGAKVINLSFGSTDYSQMLEDAVNYAYNANCLVVAAAGNDGTNETFYPAAYTNAMAVSATDENDNPASFSNYGNDISVAAPGTDILSTYWDPTDGSTYASMSGTSMATPIVSGIAALAFSQDLTRSNYDVRSIIQQNADDVSGSPGWNQYTGYGRVDVYNVVTGKISGTIFNSKTGLGIPNANVQLVNNGITLAQTATDSNGNYQFIHVKQGSYSVAVTATGYSNVSNSGISVTPGYTTSNVNLYMNPTTTSTTSSTSSGSTTSVPTKKHK